MSNSVLQSLCFLDQIQPRTDVSFVSKAITINKTTIIYIFPHRFIGCVSQNQIASLLVETWSVRGVQ